MNKLRNNILTVILTVVTIIYIVPIFIVLLNSFKENTYVKTETFAFPSADSYVGWAN